MQMLTPDVVKKMSCHINRYSQLDVEIIVQVIKILHFQIDNNIDNVRKYVSIIIENLVRVILTM